MRQQRTDKQTNQTNKQTDKQNWTNFRTNSSFGNLRVGLLLRIVRLSGDQWRFLHQELSPFALVREYSKTPPMAMAVPGGDLTRETHGNLGNKDPSRKDSWTVNHWWLLWKHQKWVKWTSISGHLSLSFTFDGLPAALWGVTGVRKTMMDTSAGWSSTAPPPTPQLAAAKEPRWSPLASACSAPNGGPFCVQVAVTSQGSQVVFYELPSSSESKRGWFSVQLSCTMGDRWNAGKDPKRGELVPKPIRFINSAAETTTGSRGSNNNFAFLGTSWWPCTCCACASNSLTIPHPRVLRGALTGACDIRAELQHSHVVQANSHLQKEMQRNAKCPT